MSEAKGNPVYHHALRWSSVFNEETKVALHQWLRSTADKYIFQAESTTSDEGKLNPHYQCYLHTVKPIRSKTLAISANGDLRGVEISPASTNGKVALQGYCMKELSRVAGPWADKKLYLGADLWPVERMPAWQREYIDMFQGEPHPRTCMWLVDPQGNNGKTKFLKWLVFKMNACGLGYGNAGDILNLVSKRQGRSIYVWNLTRTRSARIDQAELYAAMESVKDGYFINTKYETSDVLMDPPHVLVLANFAPDLTGLSADRWDIKGLTPDGRLRPYLEKIDQDLEDSRPTKKRK